uniref:Cell division protein FtsB n=1 Tax=Candidatus Kentrum sp. FM TaxID=2126340 RepID=A0A450SL84_9GAMM|nr:MAG: cell division protein FtsB [Candidatus Kentron sp. FM]VFJ54364.1 MAG: cell division protein FtsB [Candidatus Kentron sp. FM]VFK10278.1 MAG: cell division protein FtsB [Candidatus Kentron sp. FM]
MYAGRAYSTLQGREAKSSMKILLLLLITLLAYLQYNLWYDQDGFSHTRQLQEAISFQEQQNVALRERNRRLHADVADLKEGLTSIETRARRELGMIRKDETFFQFVDY